MTQFGETECVKWGWQAYL